METHWSSSSAAAQRLRDVERHRLQVYASGQNPPWAWPTFGVLVFLFVSSHEIRATWARLILLLMYALGIGVGLRW